MKKLGMNTNSSSSAFLPLSTFEQNGSEMKLESEGENLDYQSNQNQQSRFLRRWAANRQFAMF